MIKAPMCAIRRAGVGVWMFLDVFIRHGFWMCSWGTGLHESSLPIDEFRLGIHRVREGCEGVYS